MTKRQNGTTDVRTRRERELQQANDFHTLLLAMAGHDLRQPLQIITYVYDWLSRRLEAPSERQYLQRGSLAITQLTRQVNLLVQALRLYEREGHFEPVPVPLLPLLGRLGRENQELACRGGLRLRVRPMDVAVMSDPVLLESILRNLICNALKYTNPGGQILVGCRRRGWRIGIEVHDTGVGIPADKRSRIFDAFHSLDLTRTDGLGLGLFVVKRAADLLGHGIEVRSTVGRGSCFSILAENARGPQSIRAGALECEESSLSNALGTHDAYLRPHPLTETRPTGA
jgi:two-component system phosphate regulon sensor histidine kinase PhoR